MQLGYHQKRGTYSNNYTLVEQPDRSSFPEYF